VYAVLGSMNGWEGLQRVEREGRESGDRERWQTRVYARAVTRLPCPIANLPKVLDIVYLTSYVLTFSMPAFKINVFTKIKN